MDPDCEPLDRALYPANKVHDPLDMGSMRYKWRKSIVFACNWKVALEAFDEIYHVQETHRQLLEWQDDISASAAHGRHGMCALWPALPLGYRSRRLGGPLHDDVRPGIAAYMQELKDTLDFGAADEMVVAANRVMQEVAPGAGPDVALGKYMEFLYEQLEREGSAAPSVTAEEAYALGSDWHFFPNQILLANATGVLGYRSRPNGHDPDSCIFDCYSLVRYPGGEPTAKVEVQWSEDAADEAFWGLILCQDYQNMAEVQKGLKSRGFRGARPNPVQEIPVSNFHRALHEFLQSD
ncbi:MAG: hypothetical protein JO127_11195 [Caulobacteraceae bacterium]|nr:hypothetical protein [Caulobacteraceae bacterium]